MIGRRNSGPRHVVPREGIFLSHGVMGVSEPSLQEAEQRAWHGIGGGHRPPGQQQEQAASAAKERAIHGQMGRC